MYPWVVGFLQFGNGGLQQAQETLPREQPPIGPGARTGRPEIGHDGTGVAGAGRVVVHIPAEFVAVMLPTCIDAVFEHPLTSVTVTV